MIRTLELLVQQPFMGRVLVDEIEGSLPLHKNIRAEGLAQIDHRLLFGKQCIRLVRFRGWDRRVGFPSRGRRAGVFLEQHVHVHTAARTVGRRSRIPQDGGPAA